jgi:hypothetical protein
MLTEVSFKSNVVAGPKHFVFGIAFARLMVGAPQIGTAQTVSRQCGPTGFCARNDRACAEDAPLQGFRPRGRTHSARD